MFTRFEKFSAIFVKKYEPSSHVEAWLIRKKGIMEVTEKVALKSEYFTGGKFHESN